MDGLQKDRRAEELAEETRSINERLIVAGIRMQELAEEAEAARRRLAVLAEAGRLLGASFDTSSMLPAIAELLVQDLCDVCAIDVAGGPGVAARSTVVPELLGSAAARAVEHARRRVLERDRPLVCSRAPDAEPCDPEMTEILRAGGFMSLVSVPLKGRTRVHGALTLLARGRRYGPSDATLAREIADRIELAVDRAELYRHALDAARARDDLLAAVSHDLRNPLGAIVLSADLLSKGRTPSNEGEPAIPWEPEKTRSHLERIRRSAVHMQGLIQDLVDSAKVEAGRFLVDRQPHALGPVVVEVIEMLGPLAAGKSLRLESRIDDAAAEQEVWMDRERIVQVLMNLVGNAIKFTPHEGAITVGGALSAGSVTLSVRDTGAGIAREDLPRLFDRFWQARQTARLGTGLGLFIAKAIVEAHEGEILVESEIGAGSAFHVSLPLSKPAP